MSPGQNGGSDVILELRDLKTHFHTPDGVVKAVDGVTYSLNAGETLGVVGESGCGKSVTALSILRLIPEPPGQISGEGIFFEGKDLTKMNTKELRHIRGNEISMIFQEPMTSLNPVFTVGFQIAEAVMLHQELGKKDAYDKAVEMLDLVGIPLPRQRVREYPHQLSGGMRQRVMIAMALSCNPRILLADEPTTALDVTIQAQILDLMSKLKDELGTAIIMITHDLGLIAETCKRVVVMYAGKVVEEASVEEIFANPMHPYTIGLLGSIPKLRTSPAAAEQGRLEEIPGIVPSLHRLPTGLHVQPPVPESFRDVRRERARAQGTLAGPFRPLLLSLGPLRGRYDFRSQRGMRM